MTVTDFNKSEDSKSSNHSPRSINQSISKTSNQDNSLVILRILENVSLTLNTINVIADYIKKHESIKTVVKSNSTAH